MYIRENQDGSLTVTEREPGTGPEPSGKRFAPLPRRLAGDGSEVFDWASGTVRTDLAKLQAVLLAQVDQQREAARRPALTELAGQDYCYAEKAREVADYRGLSVTALAALTLAQRQQRFVFSMAEVALTGEGLAAVIARFEAGMDSSNRAVVARVEALATRAKRLIRGAATPAAARAAANITWS